MKVPQRPLGALGLYFHRSDKKMRPLLQFSLLLNSCSSKSTLSSHREMRTHTYTHAYTHTHTHTHPCTCTHVCMRAHGHTRTYFPDLQ